MILLDTCTLLWLAGNQQHLSDNSKQLLRRHAGQLYVSAISAFEIGVKCGRGAFVLPRPPQEWYPSAVQFHGLTEIPVTGRIAVESTLLPTLHKDPCDRIIVATAQLSNLIVLTPDKLITAYPSTRTAW